MFTFNDMTEDAGKIARRIRRALASRSATSIGELCLRLSRDKTSVIQSELEAMVNRGEVERLRPVDSPWDGFASFRLRRASMTAYAGTRDGQLYERPGDKEIIRRAEKNRSEMVFTAA